MAAVVQWGSEARRFPSNLSAASDVWGRGSSRKLKRVFLPLPVTWGPDAAKKGSVFSPPEFYQTPATETSTMVAPPAGLRHTFEARSFWETCL